MAAGRRIDHAVVAVRDLSAAAERYEALGFTLTPRASHPDHLGTANRLAQFANRSFIELIEADRPHLQAAHDFTASPKRFSFGAHVTVFTRDRDGMVALVLASDDAHADAERFAAAGIETYAPLDFERHAPLPDGTRSTVAFSLAFATDSAMPTIAFYTCQNRYPDAFWKPAFQSHANGATGIAAVTLIADRPEDHADFLATVIGSKAEPIDGGLRFPCGHEQALLVLTPNRAAQAAAPGFASMTLAVSGASPDEVTACGTTLRWQAK